MKHNKMRFKFIIPIILAVTTIAGIIAIGIKSSDTYAVDFTEGSVTYTYTASTKTLKIATSPTSASGAVTNNWKSNANLKDLIATIEKVTISNKITEIEASAFEDCTALETVTFSTEATCEYIRDNAFKNCKKLTAFTIPDTVKNIGSSAFSGCTSLATVTVGTGVTSIGTNAFKDAPLTTKLQFNAINCTNYNNAFTGKQIKTVTIGSKVTVIPENFIKGNKAIKNIILPDTVTNIKADAFKDAPLNDGIWIRNKDCKIETVSTISKYTSVFVQLEAKKDQSSFTGVNPNTGETFSTLLKWLNENGKRYIPFTYTVASGSKVSGSQSTITQNGSLLNFTSDINDFGYKGKNTSKKWVFALSNGNGGGSNVINNSSFDLTESEYFWYFPVTYSNRANCGLQAANAMSPNSFYAYSGGIYDFYCMAGGCDHQTWSGKVSVINVNTGEAISSFTTQKYGKGGVGKASGIIHGSVTIPEEGEYKIQFNAIGAGTTNEANERVGFIVFNDYFLQPKKTVTCIDLVKGSNVELGRVTSEDWFRRGDTVSGADFGDKKDNGFYYADYEYDSCSTAVVQETGTVVYRYFKGKSNILTVNPAGGTWNSSTATQKFELPEGATKAISLPTRTGYNFNGWTITPNNVGSKMSSLTQAATFTMGSADTTLTATWTPITYQVAYHGNGNTNTNVTMPNSTHTYNVDKNLSKNLYERKYHVIYNYNGKPGANEDTVDAIAQFINWKAQSENKTYTDEQSVKNLCSTQGAVYHLDAQWRLATLTLPSPTRPGYTFKGWSKNQNATAPDAGLGPGASFTPEQDTKLYAVWEPYSATVTLKKTDSITGEALTGATFGLYEWNGSSYVRKSTLKDNGNGTYTTEVMVYRDGQGGNNGKFKIVEEKAPTYYTNSGYEKEIQLTEAGRHDYTTGYDLTNEPNKVKVQAIKVDSETGNRIEGATFAIYEWNKDTQQYELYSRNNSKNEVDETMHFGQDRAYLSEWLYSNRKNEGKFKIVEVKAPEGYYGDFSNGTKKENDVIITENVNGQTINLQNEDGVYKNTRVKGTINVSKIDKETNRYLAQGDASLDGAEYGLYAAEDIIHKDTVTGKIYGKDELVKTAIITNGALAFKDVEIGKYYVKEITPPVGYLKDETKYEVNVNYEGETVELLTRETTVIEQIKKQAFKIKKVSSNSSTTELYPLANAGFKIYLIKDLEGVKNGTLKPSNGVQYTANDFIGYDFSGEKTALDYSKTPEGERIVELFSDAEGNVISPELAYGKYVVIESTVPEDMLPIDPFIVKIEEDSRTPQSQRVVVDQEFEALIKIIKKDSQTGQTVLNKNAKYRIWNITKNEYVEQTFTYPTKVTYGTEENPYETNEKGEFITPLRLQIGQYELREIQAPEGYILAGHEGKMEQGTYTEEAKPAVKFNVKANTVHYEDPDLKEVIIEVEQYNEQALGELEITKTGEYLKGTNTREDGTIDPLYEEGAIQGVEFEIYAKEDIYTQDNQGTKLCEKDQLIRTIITDEQGKAYQDNLPIGKYYVKEAKTVEGFVLNKEIKEFEIAYGGEETPVQKVEISYKNERQKIDLNGKEGLKVEKIADKTVYQPGEEITYTIKVSNSSEYTIKDIKVEETMIEGKFEDIETDNITKIGDKTVEIKELEPGEEVELKFIVEIAEDEKMAEKLETDKVKITNKIKAKGKIEKPGLDPEDIEGEAEEEIYITNKKLVIVKEALKEEYQIGETAQYVIKVINNGKEDITKILIEEQMLDGKFVYLEEANKNGVEIAGEGQKVAINKIEPGETVILRYEYTITESTKVTLNQANEMILSNTVKAQGKVEKPDPEAPDNIITEDVEDESTEEVKVTELDKNHIGIIKKDIETGETIQGATIGLYAGEDIKDKQGNIIIAKDTLIEKAETNKWGKAKYSIDLPLGKYYIKELEAPDGYNLSQEIVEIDGTYKGPEIEEISVSKTLGNRSTGIKIQKKDTNGRYLSGAKLEIVDEKGNTIDSWETTNVNHIFRKLEIGKIYILREVEPAKGYTTAKEIRFTINQEEKVYCIEQETEEGITVRDLKTVDSVEMIDEKTKVTIEVVDKETEEPISGIKVEVVDKETGEIIYEYETNGEPKTILGIPIGEYDIITTDPENRGYVTETNEIKVEDTSGEQKVKIKQDYIKVEINLRDEETKEKIKEGRFEIIDEKGKVIKTEETKEGTIKIERLPLGKYTIHQTEAPKGYFEAEDIKVEIRNTGELQIFDIYNKKKVINYAVEKTISSIILNGQNIEITNNKLAKLEVKTSEVKNTELIASYNIKVTNEGEVEGKVTVLETIPKGYEILEIPGYWKTRTDGTLQTEVELEAGVSRDLSITLRWTNNEINLGSRTNKAQLEGQEDGNPEDDISEATIVVSIKTGEKVSIIIIGMIIIALIIAGYITYRVIQRKGPSINRIRFLK